MKRFFLIGGFIGFALTFAACISSGGSVTTALRNGMVGCFVIAFLARILYSQIESATLVVLEQEFKAMEAEEQEEQT